MVNAHYERATKFELSRLAASTDDVDFARAALEEQFKKFGWNQDEAEGVVAGTFKTEEGIAEALKVYNNKYSSAIGSMKMGDFAEADVYGNVLKDLLDEAKYQRAIAEFQRYSSETYEGISKKAKKAEIIVKNAKVLGVSEDEKRQAEDTLKKYALVIPMLKALEDNKLEGLRPKVKKRATKNFLEAILKE